MLGPNSMFVPDSTVVDRFPNIGMFLLRDEVTAFPRNLPETDITKKQTLVFATRTTSSDTINMTMCELGTRYVDTHFECTRASFQGTRECRATKMKHSEGWPVSGNATFFTQALVSWVPWNIPLVLANYHVNTPGGLDTLLQDPLFTGALSLLRASYWDLNVPMSLFEARLSVILNTFSMAVSNPDYISGINGSTTSGNTTLRDDAGEWASGNGTWTEFTDQVYVVNWAWFALYVCAVLVMAACGVANIALHLLIRSPDFLTSVSALTRDSPFITVPPGGSALDGLDRTRLIKNKRISIRDVQPDEAVGRIALSDATGVGMVDWTRKYV